MREWMINNTNVNIDEYDALLNSNMLYKIGEKRKKCNYTFDRKCPISKIDSFTYGKPNKLKCLLFNVKKDGDFYFYKDIKFNVLSKYIPSLRKELYKMSRGDKCVLYSSDICFNIKGSKIVTILCDNPFFKEKPKYLHTFVTCFYNDVEYVIDATINLIMEKEEYLKIFDGKIISEVEREDMVTDIKFLQSLELKENEISMQEYLCFKDDVMEGANKYKK